MPGPIVSAAIHPGLGVARMGNSTEYILAPQVMAPPSPGRPDRPMPPMAP